MSESLEKVEQLSYPELERLAAIEDDEANPWWQYHDELERRFSRDFGLSANGSRWRITSKRTPSGKVLFRCKGCPRFSPTPDKECPSKCAE